MAWPGAALRLPLTRRPAGVSMHPARAIPPELIVSLSSAAATSLGPFTASGWQAAAANTPGKRSSITPPTSSSATGQLGLLTVALVLITVTLAARPR